MTHYERHLQQIVDADPEVVSARARVAKLEKELLDAKISAANALSIAIARAKQ